jgi:hypothetical protein
VAAWIVRGTLRAERKQALEARGAPAERAQLDAEFDRLVEAASSAARQASDVRVKISNYRIAATAAWQRLDQRTVTLAREGSAVCNSGNGFELAPRDCAMLLIIPDLLVNDVWASRYPDMEREPSPSGGGFAAKYRSAVDELVEAYRALGLAERRVSSTPVAREMIQLIQSSRAAIGRTIGRMIDLFVGRIAAPDDRREIRAICASIRANATRIVPRRCAVPANARAEPVPQER